MWKILDYIHQQRKKLVVKSKEIHEKHRRVIQLQQEVAVDKQQVESEKMKVEMMKQELKEQFDQLKVEKLKISSQKKLLQEMREQAKKQGLKQANSGYFKGLDQLKGDKSRHKLGPTNYTNDSEIMNEDENDSPMPCFNKNMQQNNNFDYNQPVDSEEMMQFEGNQNIHNKYSEDYDTNQQREYDNYTQDENYEVNDNASTQYDFPKNSSRNLIQEFSRNADAPNPAINYENNLNGSYCSEDYPENIHNKFRQINADMNREDHYGRNQNFQNMQRNNQRESQNTKMKNMKSRFNDQRTGQEQYYPEAQRSQERRNYQNNQNMSNSYYEMGPSLPPKSPTMANARQVNPNFRGGPQFIQQEKQAENQMQYNNSYQVPYITGGQFGEMSFVRDYNNPNNIISGQSTDRFQKSRNQGLHNYMSAGHPGNSNGPNSVAYSSQPSGVPDQNIPHVQTPKEYMQNPPTFHPYHHQMNGQNNMQSQNPYMLNHTGNLKINDTRDSQAMPDPRSAQVTPKPASNKFMNFESQMNSNYQYPGSREDSRDRINPNRPFIYENFKELEQQNSQWDRQHQTFDNQTMGSLQESYNFYPQQRNNEVQDSRMASIRGNKDNMGQREEESYSVQKEKEKIAQLIGEYQRRLAQLDQSNEKEKAAPDTPESKHIKILQGEEEKKLNLNTNLEKYINKSEKDDEEPDVDGYIQNNLGKNQKLIEQIKQQKHIKDEKLLEKELIKNLLNSKQNIDVIHQTPQKRLDQSLHSVQSKEKKNVPPGFPHLITDSMRKIRNSPMPAENEHGDDMEDYDNYSPNSCVRNHYEEDEEERKDNTVCRVKTKGKYSITKSHYFVLY